MIKANEIRIGNIISWRTGFGELIIGSVYEVHTDKVAIGPETVIDANSSGQGFMKLKGIEPVLLTPEWLERMGFKWNQEDWGYFIQVGNTLYIEFEKDFDCSIVPETWRGVFRNPVG